MASATEPTATLWLRAWVRIRWKAWSMVSFSPRKDWLRALLRPVRSWLLTPARLEELA